MCSDSKAFFARNSHPCQRLDPQTDPEATAPMERFNVDAGALPIVLCLSGRAVAGKLRQRPSLPAPWPGALIDPDRMYDVAIVGAGLGGALWPLLRCGVGRALHR